MSCSHEVGLFSVIGAGGGAMSSVTASELQPVNSRLGDLSPTEFMKASSLL
jgi:hypothetical protein